MAVAAGWNRRALFTRQGLQAGSRLLAGLRSQCPDRQHELTVARRVMACEFSVIFPAGSRSAVEAGCAALDEAERLERKLSVYLEDSDVSRLNAQAADAPARVDAELYGLLRSAAELSRVTGGAFDAASGALIRAWGFCHGPKRVPTDAERTATLAASGSTHVHFHDEEQSIQFDCTGIEFNLGGIGKGFAIDRALHAVCTRFRITSALMQGGQSSLKGIGAPPGEPRGWTVAIGDPLQPARPLAYVRLRNRALGTSGGANQFFLEGGRRYGHVLDPRTGWPATGLLSASAVARTATEADALSTAFYVDGPERTRRFCHHHPEIGAVMVLPPSRKNDLPEVVTFGAVDAEVLGATEGLP